MKLYYLVPVLMLSLHFSSMAQNVTLNISNINNVEGKLQVGVFENEAQYEDEKPGKILFFDKSGLENKSKKVTFRLSPGTYAITVLDDRDGSKDLTYRFGIYPVEGVGFSNYYLSGFSKPKFSDFSFTLSEADIEIDVAMRNF